MTDESDITPPRSDDLIRSKLASIASAPNPESRGELVRREGHRVLLTTFHGLANCRAFQAELSTKNIHSNRTKRRNRFELEVDEEDRQAAEELLRRFLATNPDLRDENARRRFDATILLALVFGGVAMALSAAEGAIIQALFVGIRFAVFGLMLGFLVDQFRCRERSGLVMVFLLIAIAALLFWVLVAWFRFMQAPA